MLGSNAVEVTGVVELAPVARIGFGESCLSVVTALATSGPNMILVHSDACQAGSFSVAVLSIAAPAAMLATKGVRSLRRDWLLNHGFQ